MFIFILHNDYLDNKNLNHKIIKHKLNNDDLEKGYLTWVVRKHIWKNRSIIMITIVQRT